MTDAALRTGPARFLLRDLVFSRSFAGRPYLISPLADVLMAGGAGLLALAFFLIMLPKTGGRGISASDVAITGAVFAALSYVVNYPHFMASYQLLYGTLNRRMAAVPRGGLMWWRYVIAAYIVPVLLVAYFAVAVATQNTFLLGLSVQIMFFFVGWHYVKQAYGVFVVLSGLKGIFYSRYQVIALKLHVYSLWLYMWFTSGAVVLQGMSPRPLTFHNIQYEAFNLFKSQALVEGLLWPVVVLAILGWGAIIWNWVATRKRPSLSGLLGYTSMYSLLAFVTIHPLFIFAAPMFHSLQYMLFVYAYKRGEFSSAEPGHAPQAGGPDMAAGKPYWMRMLGYFLMICATGALFFDVIPLYFDVKSPRWGWPLLATPMFHVFINTHHYFIDSAIWRKGDREVSRNLFARP